jgi:GH24 family phage-related lysozyme (muramidase)
MAARYEVPNIPYTKTYYKVNILDRTNNTAQELIQSDKWDTLNEALCHVRLNMREYHNLAIVSMVVELGNGEFVNEWRLLQLVYPKGGYATT